MIVTLSETTRGLDGWFTTATPEGGEPFTLLLRHGDVEDYRSARDLALRWVWKTWPDAVVRRAERELRVKQLWNDPDKTTGERHNCEHCIKLSPPGMRFCSLQCQRCELESSGETGCDGICAQCSVCGNKKGSAACQRNHP